MSNELYDQLEPDVRQQLVRHEKARTVPPATALISRGTFPENLVILDAGSVEISLWIGKKMVSTVIQEGGKVFGLREILGHAAAEADVISQCECEVRLISKESFTAVLEEHPEIYAALARVLCTDMRTANDLLRRTPRHPPDARLGTKHK